jgi:hypothetical protein
MRYYRWWWIVLLDLLSGLSLVLARSSASAETIPRSLANSAGTLDRQLEATWAERGPVIRALTTEEARRLKPLRSDSDRPAVRPEQKAVLLSPCDGGELVDQLMAEEMRHRAIPMGTTGGYLLLLHAPVQCA